MSPVGETGDPADRYRLFQTEGAGPPEVRNWKCIMRVAGSGKNLRIDVAGTAELAPRPKPRGWLLFGLPSSADFPAPPA